VVGHREATCLVGAGGQSVKPKGYWLAFCAHERPKWHPCGMCKRDKRQAQENYDLLMTGRAAEMRQ